MPNDLRDTAASASPPAADPRPPAADHRPPRRPAAFGLKDYSAATAPAQRLHAAALEDRRLADRLLALRPAERLHAVESDVRCQRLSLATLFVLAAEDALLDPAGDPEPAAELAAAIAAIAAAAAIAGRQPGDGGGKVRRTAALAHWLLGKALLRSRSWRRANQAFETIFAYIPDQSPSAERGLVSYGFAQLYADTERRRPPMAAIGMATLAARHFSILAAAAEEAACHAQLGLLLHESGDLEHAAIDLMQALRILARDPALAPSLTARLLLALATVEATLGGAAAARLRLRSARRLYPLAPSISETVERSWREAQALAAVGSLAEAEPRMARVRRELLAAGSLAEAARATLDHAQLRLDAGRVDTVGELAGALAAAFPGHGEPWAGDVAALAQLGGGGAPSRERYAAAYHLRRRLRRRPPPSPGRPDLIVPWRLLTDRLLRGRAETAAPTAAPNGI